MYLLDFLIYENHFVWYRGTGTTSLSVVYGALVLSCAFVPSWLISRLRVKWTMVLCVLGYSAYIAAQFYPRCVGGWCWAT